MVIEGGGYVSKYMIWEYGNGQLLGTINIC
jgi:hypothetical protein